MGPYEQTAAALKGIIDTEFAPESITAVHDNLHDSLGEKRVSVGLAPLRETPSLGNMVQLETWIEVKFFDLWEKKVDPTQSVNPIKITRYADRFRRAVEADQRTPAGNSVVWYFDVMDVQYPKDPTGNHTRFVAQVRAFGTNDGLNETTG